MYDFFSSSENSTLQEVQAKLIFGKIIRHHKTNFFIIVSPDKLNNIKQAKVPPQKTKTNRRLIRNFVVCKAVDF